MRKESFNLTGRIFVNFFPKLPATMHRFPSEMSSLAAIIFEAAVHLNLSCY